MYVPYHTYVYLTYGAYDPLVRYLAAGGYQVVVADMVGIGASSGQKGQAFSFAVEFDETDYAAVAEEFGVTGSRVEGAEEYEETLAAVDSPGPALVDLPVRPLPTFDDVPVD